MAKIILLNKPYGVLSQFTDREARPTLAQFVADRRVRVAGRLDFDSEGLVVLSDDGALIERIAHPRHKLTKIYWVQVEGNPTRDQLQQLRDGVLLRDGATRPAKVRPIVPPAVWEREPPIRHRLTVPTHWLEIRISEGRNRQVRRMTAAVGLPTLRLIRCAVGPWTLTGLASGESRIIELDHTPAAEKKSAEQPRRRHSSGQAQRNQVTSKVSRRARRYSG
jgi:23S rRNA pseudouridine2457 synthase